MTEVNHKPNLQVNLPVWYKKFASPIRVLASILVIPFAACCIEILLRWSGVYSPAHPWPWWFILIALSIGIPSMMVLERLSKFDSLKSQLTALKSGFPDRQKVAAISVRTRKSDAKYVVPALISAMRECPSEVVNELAETLKHLTGQDFGTDRSRWEEWWQEKASGARNIL